MLHVALQHAEHKVKCLGLTFVPGLVWSKKMLSAVISEMNLYTSVWGKKNKQKNTFFFFAIACARECFQQHPSMGNHHQRAAWALRLEQSTIDIWKKHVNAPSAA